MCDLLDYKGVFFLITAHMQKHIDTHMAHGWNN